jgi:hypothetical protein
MDAISAAFNSLCSPCKRETRLQAIRRHLDLPVIKPMTFGAAVTVEDYDMGPVDLSPAGDFRHEEHVLGDSDGILEGTWDGWELNEQGNALISPFGSDAPPSALGDKNTAPSDPVMAISPLFSPIESHPGDTSPTTLGYKNTSYQDMSISPPSSPIESCLGNAPPPSLGDHRDSGDGGNPTNTGENQADVQLELEEGELLE